jgi:hypothetical protein
LCACEEEKAASFAVQYLFGVYIIAQCYCINYQAFLPFFQDRLLHWDYQSDSFVEFMKTDLMIDVRTLQGETGRHHKQQPCVAWYIVRVSDIAGVEFGPLLSLSQDGMSLYQRGII